MGNRRFKLSNMMPNAWFYKLRDMSKVRSHNPSHSVRKNSQSSSRKSYYYSTESVRMDNKLCVSPQNPKFYDARFPHDPPRKPSRKIAPSESDIPVWLRPGNIHDYGSSHVDDPISPDKADLALSGFDCDDSWDQSCLRPCSCEFSSSATDIIIDGININFNMVSEPDLPPIKTKRGRQESPIKYMMEKPERNRRSSSSPGGRKSFSGGVKIRKGGSKKAGGRRRKSVKEERKKGLFYSESFAIVKASLDPEKDFRESMMEMIEENNIRESKDLEDLLACYLSLNPNQYHDLVIKAFEQIWFNIHQLRL